MAGRTMCDHVMYLELHMCVPLTLPAPQEKEWMEQRQGRAGQGGAGRGRGQRAEGRVGQGRAQSKTGADTGGRGKTGADAGGGEGMTVRAHEDHGASLACQLDPAFFVHLFPYLMVGRSVVLLFDEVLTALPHITSGRPMPGQEINIKIFACHMLITNVEH
eukprot:SAG11_NODE_3586_length_2351_cov_2.305506_2_plen_161_part_00